MTAETIPEKLDRIARNGYPSSATVEVTARCNARCGYCYLQDCSFKELSTEQLCAAIDKLSKSGVFHLHVSGGEPFLRPDILDVLSFAFDHGIFQCTLFSNGILLNNKHREFIVKNRDFFRDIQMSVFSHVPEINDRFLGVPGAFDAILENALFFKKNGLRVALALSLLDFNIDEMEKTRRFFEERNLPLLIAYFKIITSPHIESFVAASTTMAFFKRYFENLRPEERCKLKQEMKNLLKLPPNHNEELCYGRWNTVFMNAQGDLAPCVSFRNVKFGNIFEQGSVHDILQAAPQYHSICGFKKKDMEKCAACRFFNFCTVCLGSIHTEKGSFCATNTQMCNFANALYDILE
jgi:radical SAM protein with 4Fe4S-binding SPASM domain